MRAYGVVLYEFDTQRYRKRAGGAAVVQWRAKTAGVYGLFCGNDIETPSPQGSITRNTDG